MEMGRRLAERSMGPGCVPVAVLGVGATMTEKAGAGVPGRGINKVLALDGGREPDPSWSMRRRLSIRWQTVTRVEAVRVSSTTELSACFKQ